MARKRHVILPPYSDWAKRVAMFYGPLHGQVGWYYLKDYEANSTAALYLKLSKSFDDALNFEAISGEEWLKTYVHLTRVAAANNYELSIQMVTQQVAMHNLPDEPSAEAVREYLQRIAIAKLEADEIDAIGASRVAVYLKTKFHGVEDPDPSDPDVFF